MKEQTVNRILIVWGVILNAIVIEHYNISLSYYIKVLLFCALLISSLLLIMYEIADFEVKRHYSDVKVCYINNGNKH